MLIHRQVGIAPDHLLRHSLCNKSCLCGIQMSRIRHCVECPKCFTRYLVSFSPYRNGAYLIPTVEGSSDEYILYCVCSERAARRWKWSEVLTCDVSRPAYERGYGSPDEVLLVGSPPDQAWSFDVSKYLSNWRSIERRKNSP